MRTSPATETYVPPPVIALLTDFGWAGHFAGSMKAVILGINPAATIFDITHEIAPQAVEEGAFILGAVIPFLPEGAVCVVVVDPGVGTRRPAIALRTERGTFVGPDNGVLSAALDDEHRAAAKAPGRAGAIAVPPAYRAVRLSNRRYFHEPVSNTFHGRDIFAPVAAHLTAGVPFHDLGEPAATILAFPPWAAVRRPNGRLAGRILSIDHFGNLVTDVRTDDAGGALMSVGVAGLRIEGLSRSYQDGPEFVAYAGSSGYLEIARRNASAAAALSVRVGDAVEVEPAAPPAGRRRKA